MGQALDQFAADCHNILKQDSSENGLEKVRQGLEKFLVSDEVLNEHLGPDADSERNIIYEDSEQGFCIIAHVYKGPKVSGPHDHGPAWAMYGQAVGETEMREYDILEAPANGVSGKVKVAKTYNMTPGVAVAYGVGKVHAPTRTAETRLIRMEGMNMGKVKRDKFELA
jgi:predicted metal-dependent enzyme (double-stranded beta helix superfamily)